MKNNLQNKMYIATLEWDMDKCRWIIAKNRTNARKLAIDLMGFNDYKDKNEKFEDFHILFEIPPDILQLYVLSEITSEIPDKETQEIVNDNVVGMSWIH